jgi:hypothetical protein
LLEPAGKQQPVDPPAKPSSESSHDAPKSVRGTYERVAPGSIAEGANRLADSGYGKKRTARPASALGIRRVVVADNRRAARVRWSREAGTEVLLEGLER